MTRFDSYHAHFYFDPHEAEEAGAVCTAMKDALGIPMGAFTQSRLARTRAVVPDDGSRRPHR